MIYLCLVTSGLTVMVTAMETTPLGPSMTLVSRPMPLHPTTLMDVLTTITMAMRMSMMLVTTMLENLGSTAKDAMITTKMDGRIINSIILMVTFSSLTGNSL